MNISRTSVRDRGAMIWVLSGAVLLGGCQMFDKAQAKMQGLWAPAPETMTLTDESMPVGGLAADMSDDEWLDSPPLMLTALFAFDPAKYIPIPGDSTLAAEADPLPIDAGRVRLQHLGPNRFRIDLDVDDITFEHQRNDAWCWAACARTVNEFNRRGNPDIVSLEQEQLAGYFKGGDENQAADVTTIMRALCLDLEAYHRRNLVTLGMDFENVGPTRLVRDLSAGSMPIVGLSQEGGGGHAVIVTGVTYAWTEAGQDLVSYQEFTSEAGAAIDEFDSVRRKVGKVTDLLGRVSDADERRGVEDKKGKKKEGKKGKKKEAKAEKAAEKAAKQKDNNKDGGGKGRRKDKDKGEKADGVDLDIDTEVAGQTVSVMDLLEGAVDVFAIESVSILDPWAPDEPVLVLTGDAFREQLDFIMTRELAYEIFTRSGDSSRRTLTGEIAEAAGFDIGSFLGLRRP